MRRPQCPASWPSSMARAMAGSMTSSPTMDSGRAWAMSSRRREWLGSVTRTYPAVLLGETRARSRDKRCSATPPRPPEHREPVQSQKRLGQPDTVTHRQGSPVLVAFDSYEDVGTPGPCGGYPQLRHAPQFNAKRRITTRLANGRQPDRRSVGEWSPRPAEHRPIGSYEPRLAGFARRYDQTAEPSKWSSTCPIAQVGLPVLPRRDASISGVRALALDARKWAGPVSRARWRRR